MEQCPQEKGWPNNPCATAKPSRARRCKEAVGRGAEQGFAADAQTLSDARSRQPRTICTSSTSKMGDASANHSSSQLPATRRHGKISSLGQHLLTSIWKTGDLYAFIFPLETAAPYKESAQQRTPTHTSAAVSPTAQAPTFGWGVFGFPPRQVSAEEEF